MFNTFNNYTHVNAPMSNATNSGWIKLSDDILYEVMRYVGMYNGSVRLVCGAWKECVKKQKKLIVSKLNWKRAEMMIRNGGINLGGVRELVVVDISGDWSANGEFNWREKKFDGVRDVRIVRCTYDVCGYVLNAIGNKVENVIFEECNFLRNVGFLREKFGMMKKIEFVKCYFQENDMITVFDELNVKFGLCVDGKGGGRFKGINDAACFSGVFGCNIDRENAWNVLLSCRTSLKCLSGFEALRGLTLWCCAVTDENLGLVNSELIGLEEFGLDSCVNVRRIGEFVSGLKALRVLKLINCFGLEKGDLDRMDLGCLVELELSSNDWSFMRSNEWINNLGFVGGILGLRKLNIGGLKGLNWETVPWDKLGGIEEFVVRRMHLSDCVFEGASKWMVSCIHLELGGCGYGENEIEVEVVTNAILKKLEGFGRLEKFIVSNCAWFRPEMVDVISDKMVLLRHLELRNIKIEGVMRVNKLSKLEYLDVGCLYVDGVNMCKKLGILMCGNLKNLNKEFVSVVNL